MNSVSFQILFEDEDFIALNKQSKNTILIQGKLNLLQLLYKERKIKSVPCYYIGEMTSGICLFGKNEKSAQLFLDCQKKSGFHFVYEAIVRSPYPYKEELTIEGFLIEQNGKTLLSKDSGVFAHSKVHLVKRFKDFVLVEVVCVPSFFDQVLVHLSSLGLPVVGDTIYGAKSPKIFLSSLKGSKYRLARKKTEKPLVNGTMLHLKEIKVEDDSFSQFKQLRSGRDKIFHGFLNILEKYNRIPEEIWLGLS